MKLVVLDEATFGEISLAPLAQGFASADFHASTRPEETAERIADASVVVSNKVRLDRDILSRGPHLKLICVAATGTNNVDIAAAEEMGVAVTNVPAYAIPSVVSHTFALYFHLAHHNRYHQDYTASGAWSNSPIFTHLDQPYGELEGKTWGIIGMGGIGRGVAKVAAAFGCEVIYHSTSGNNLNQPYPHHDLEEVLARADVLSIHAPLNDQTRRMLTRTELQKMQPTAILINVGRGGIVDEQDLAQALDAGDIAGAGVDVMPVEPPPADHPLLHLKHPERLILTPHIAGLSSESRRRLAGEIRRNIDAFLEGVNRNRVSRT